MSDPSKIITDDPNFLTVADDVLSRRARRRLYVGLVVIGLCLSSLVVGFASADVPVPKAITVALAVCGSLIAPVGHLAAAHVPPSEKKKDSLDADS